MFVLSVTQWSVIYRRRPLINGRGCLLWPRPFIVVSSGVGSHRKWSAHPLDIHRRVIRDEVWLSADAQSWAT
jgi:hypothetical protein